MTAPLLAPFLGRLLKIQLQVCSQFHWVERKLRQHVQYVCIQGMQKGLPCLFPGSNHMSLSVKGSDKTTEPVFLANDDLHRGFFFKGKGVYIATASCLDMPSPVTSVWVDLQDDCIACTPSTCSSTLVYVCELCASNESRASPSFKIGCPKVRREVKDPKAKLLPVLSGPLRLRVQSRLSTQLRIATSIAFLLRTWF